MTAIMNGAINFSTDDGWIPEFATKESKLPNSERINDLINDISRLAQKWKCEQLNVAFQPGVQDPNKNYIKDTWRTRWRADFFSWCRLMNEMEERFPRFVAFENMTFTIDNAGMVATGAKMEVSVDVITYRYAIGRVGGN